MGAAFFRLQQFEEARAHFWRSLNVDASAVARYRVDEWIERCDWTKHYFTRTDR
jgi:hypothetical protein